MWITSSLDSVRTPTRVALGNFDGIHRGHQCVIEPIVLGSTVCRSAVVGSTSETEAGQDSGNDAGVPTVLTFHPHPQEFFSGRQRSLLTPIEEKAAFLATLGIEQLVLLPFTQTLASLSPYDFVEQILVNCLKPYCISVGQDFCFGRDRKGTATELKAIAADFGITVYTVALHTELGDRISSSRIRQALQSGNLDEANQLLGRPYTLCGTVVQGQQLGRQIGFPTANLQLPSEKFLPRDGVYVVRVQGIAGATEAAGVMNLGIRPTVNGKQRTVEVHVFDWSGNLYDQSLTVSLEAFLRPEQTFESLDALKSQIQQDCDTARSLLATLPIVHKP
ncbi:bifunctional riboflavin kinase/FAD synthetase [Leptolyngbya sp. AN02str]|uniref:bifunctional riboflavin kinase/FAD synthetase n=1 Tax=Leptolyngbya sp. AN02str TaxID=3423363 RepID=UPI003D31D23B